MASMRMDSRGRQAQEEKQEMRVGSVVFKQGHEETNAHGTAWLAGHADWHRQDHVRRDNKVGKDKTEAVEKIEGGECEAWLAWNVTAAVGHGVRDKDCIRALLWW